ncbi:hypothetical protein LQF61_01355 [Tetragenococcus koreensis]|uniref:Uncharacterized protein n=1 Tax=Tetragenococcus koreensis TaxID=290335 RepID=A0AAN4RJG2_9ENTE|nr:hypothetical protein [Tetragenococcus koreensis]MCF1584074.1 hypothetical protein [Tetragenococcus koreensis]MCF1613535.1 hypothetical protein [Tetragenococcus koreensis]MCF1618010.1 hypothetical protein [Tetragenococcus koreensis]MCF1618726.1 hypothetical protein [Tetragenococcus koreensis]MCF1622841.1 hypothetical protein [Tetragenococcus koreensis]
MQVTNAKWPVMKIVWTKEVITSKEMIQSLQDKFEAMINEKRQHNVKQVKCMCI